MEVCLFDQQYYIGNIVNIAPAGNLPRPEGVEYTVRFSGYPDAVTPSLTLGTTSYGEGERFRAVALAKSQLSASPIDGLDCDIIVGAQTVYVNYTPGSLDYVTYTVHITGEYPEGEQPVLKYGDKQFYNGQQLTASNLTLMQLSASDYEDYARTIEIK